MKKIISLLLLLALLLPAVTTLTACSDFFFASTVIPSFPSEDDDGDDTAETPEEEEEEEDPEETPDDATPPVETDRTEDYAYTPYLPAKMPEVRVTTESGTLNFATDITHITQKWNNEIQYEGCSVSLTNCEDAYALTDVTGQIKVRGNYTIMYPKQPFRLKFSEKQSMLGMNEGRAYKSWVLLAEWKDSSMLFDATAYYLGQTILGSDGYYCTDYRFVKLYLNDQYWGVYLLAEQQQTGVGRVNVTEPMKNYMGTDIGYFFEYDGYYDKEDVALGGDYTFTIDYNNNATFRDRNGNYVDTAFFRGYTIKSDIYAEAQRACLEKYVANTYTALHRTLFSDIAYILDSNGDLRQARLDGIKTKEEAVRQLIDVQSLVDTYILNEICCDYDLHWSSFYMSLDLSTLGNKKLTFCAPWDFDTAFGSKNSSKYVNTTTDPTKYSGLDSCETAETPYAGVNRNPWLLLLMNEEWFMDEVKAKWAELVKYRIPQTAITQIDTVTIRYSTQLTENANRAWVDVNQKSSTYPNGKTVYQIGDPSPSHELINDIAKCTTQKQASDRLRGWLTTRFNYLNDEWGDGTALF